MIIDEIVDENRSRTMALVRQRPPGSASARSMVRSDPLHEDASPCPGPDPDSPRAIARASRSRQRRGVRFASPLTDVFVDTMIYNLGRLFWCRVILLIFDVTVTLLRTRAASGPAGSAARTRAPHRIRIVVPSRRPFARRIHPTGSRSRLEAPASGAWVIVPTEERAPRGSTASGVDGISAAIAPENPDRPYRSNSFESQFLVRHHRRRIVAEHRRPYSSVAESVEDAGPGPGRTPPERPVSSSMRL